MEPQSAKTVFSTTNTAHFRNGSGRQNGSPGASSCFGGSIDFPRVARWEAADQMVVRFAPAEAERSLRLSPGFADALQIEGVQPEPSSSTTGTDGTVMVFDTVIGAPAQVILHVTPMQPGWPRFEASIDDGRPTAMTMLVLPWERKWTPLFAATLCR